MSRAGLDHVPGLGVLALDVVLQFGGLHAPLTSAAHLDRRQFAAVDERVGLPRRDAQHLRDVRQVKEPGWHAALLCSAPGAERTLGPASVACTKLAASSYPQHGRPGSCP